MNPLALVPLLAYTTAAVLWPAQIDGLRRGRVLLLVEALLVLAAVVVGQLLAKLVIPSAAGYRWGGVGLYVTAYLYVCFRGMVLVRSVLELPALQMRRDDDSPSRSCCSASTGRWVSSSPLSRSPALRPWKTANSPNTS